MPELPEVETIKKELAKVVTGRTIIAVSCNAPRMLNLLLKISGLITQAKSCQCGAARQTDDFKIS
jgi:formamidopyrimidine-DNA glycosylase